MSIWSTNGRHNALIADALAVHSIIEATPETVEHAYHTLAEENELSLNARYGDPLDSQANERYPYLPGGEITPGQLAGLVESYDYQSCEHRDYQTSQTAEWIRLLRDAIKQHHNIVFVAIDFTSPDYAWSINDLPAQDNDAWHRHSQSLNHTTVANS